MKFQTKAKKSISMLLSLLMIISLFTALPFSAGAVLTSQNSTMAGDSIATATGLGLSSFVNGSITETNPSDFYKITIPDNSSIEFNLELTSYMESVYLRVYDSLGNEFVKENPYWNYNINQITETYTLYLDPGTYYVGIMDNYYTGNYTLSTSYKNLNNLDLTYDDTIESAHNIELTKSFTGVLTNVEESDIYKINVKNPGILKCLFSAYMGGIYLKLLDSNGTQIISENPYWNDNIGYSTNEYIFSLEKGTYYIQVFADWNYRGKYNFVNTFTSINSTEKENNDTIANANAISLGSKVTGLLGENEESDIFKVVIPSSGTVSINFRAYMEEVYLKIYTSQGEEIYSENPYCNQNIGYSNNDYEYTLSAGTYYVQIRTDWKYRGKYNLTVRKPKSISKAKVSTIPVQTYKGKYIKPSVTVKYGSIKLKSGTDYTVTYSDNYYVGKAIVTITGKGNYTGAVYKTFKIIPKSIKLKSLKNVKKKSMVVKWSKNRNASGYQIVYSTNKSFKKSKKFYVSWGSSNKTTLYNLKKNKTYYVKIRAYNWSVGKRIYSKYSSVKSKRIKK